MQSRRSRFDARTEAQERVRENTKKRLKMEKRMKIETNRRDGSIALNSRGMGDKKREKSVRAFTEREREREREGERKRETI